jgi:hypothetical protein
MKDLALIVIHLLATTAKLLGPGGLRAVMIENALLRQQLMFCVGRDDARRRAESDDVGPVSYSVSGCFSSDPVECRKSPSPCDRQRS